MKRHGIRWLDIYVRVRVRVCLQVACAAEQPGYGKLALALAPRCVVYSCSGLQGVVEMAKLGLEDGGWVRL